MNLNPQIVKSVEQLDYRVTVGDVASRTGLEIDFAQQELLNLASSANGHLQVADTGEIVYLFSPNFRSILRNKYWQLRLREWWQKIWQVLFYLIRISFGIVLILSIMVMLIAIAVIVIAISSSRNGEGDSSRDRRGGGGGIIFLPNFWFSPDLFWVFSPDYQQARTQKRASSEQGNQLNFLEAIFSFLFGDGNPNANLEERRWQAIGAVIRNQQGAVVAEQIAPYLDGIEGVHQEGEDYMLPVLTKFNGYPEVSPEGQIIYYFPDLQVTARQREKTALVPYLQENLWQFSQAGSGQKILAVGLGGFNFVLALVLGSLLTPEVAAELGGFINFVNSIYWLLLGYGTAYLAIPLIRYFWLQTRNEKIKTRNLLRQERANLLKSIQSKIQPKLDYARQFAAEKVIGDRDIAYSTDRDILDQQLERSDKIDAEWQERLNRAQD